MGDEVEHLRKKIDYLTSEVMRVESLLAGASSSPLLCLKLESELLEHKQDLHNAKLRLADYYGAMTSKDKEESFNNCKTCIEVAYDHINVAESKTHSRDDSYALVHIQACAKWLSKAQKALKKLESKNA